MKRFFSWMLCMLMLFLCCACGQQEPAPAPIGEAAGPQVQTQAQPAVPVPPVQEIPPTPAPAEPQPEPVLQLPTVSGEQDSYNLTWEEMQDPAFWIALCDDPQAIRMTKEEIDAYNTSLPTISGTKTENLAAWPESLSMAKLLKLLNNYGPTPDDGYYTPDGRITPQQRAEMGENRNCTAVQETNPVQYGFLTENLIMRTFPSPVPLYDSPDAWEYDKAAETALKLWEPVLVLHTSADGQWLLVQAYDYLGWVEIDKVALCDRARWDELREMLQNEYLTVLAPRLVMDGSFHHPWQENVVLKMGTVLPLTQQSKADNAIADNCYIVRLPHRLADGSLDVYTARIPKNEDVTVGSLPFTTENLLNQAFKLLGHRYGWGGTAEGWDCSSICQDVYRTMGLFLPRNSGNQRQLPGWHNVEDSSVEQKLTILGTLLPGAMPELKGHQTMYIGRFDGQDYVIHATHGVYDGKGKLYEANSVIVSSVEARRSNGKTLMENFRAFSMPSVSAP